MNSSERAWGALIPLLSLSYKSGLPVLLILGQASSEYSTALQNNLWHSPGRPPLAGGAVVTVLIGTVLVKGTRTAVRDWRHNYFVVMVAAVLASQQLWQVPGVTCLRTSALISYTGVRLCVMCLGCMGNKCYIPIRNSRSSNREAEI